MEFQRPGETKFCVSQLYDFRKQHSFGAGLKVNLGDPRCFDDKQFDFQWSMIEKKFHSSIFREVFAEDAFFGELETMDVHILVSSEAGCLCCINSLNYPRSYSAHPQQLGSPSIDDQIGSHPREQGNPGHPWHTRLVEVLQSLGGHLRGFEKSQPESGIFGFWKLQGV